jgi:hypothetical protein
MASFKYDGYRDYLAGARFPETLADWLMQFRSEDRTAAYAFVKSTLAAENVRRVLLNRIRESYAKNARRDAVTRSSTRRNAAVRSLWRLQQALARRFAARQLPAAHSPSHTNSGARTSTQVAATVIWLCVCCIWWSLRLVSSASIAR